MSLRTLWLGFVILNAPNMGTCVFCPKALVCCRCCTHLAEHHICIICIIGTATASQNHTGCTISPFAPFSYQFISLSTTCAEFELLQVFGILFFNWAKNRNCGFVFQDEYLKQQMPLCHWLNTGCRKVFVTQSSSVKGKLTCCRKVLMTSIKSKRFL